MTQQYRCHYGEKLAGVFDRCDSLKVHKIENFFGSEFEFYTISLLVMHKY